MNGSKLHSYSRHRRRVYFIVLAIAVFIASSFPFDLQAARGEPRVIEIRAKRFEYIPNVIEIKKGEKVLLKLTSEDVTHGFFLDGYELEFFVNPGETRQVMLKADKEGKFMFRCSTTCGVFHPYMVGYLKVTPNTPFTFAMLGIILLGLGSLVITLVRKKENPDKLFGIIPIKWRFELTRFKIVRKLLKSRLFPFALILFNLFVFVIILFAAFFGGNSTGNYNFGIMIVWILWWFLLMGFMVPVIGRFWCMMCPFPMVGEWFQRGKLFKMGRLKSRGLAKKWPKNWRNLWPVTILFFISTWASGFFTVRPMSTFILLGVIILGAIVLSSIFEKRTFCLYVCPVSGFQGLYANSSVCEVRVKDTEVCKNHKVKTCVVGNEKGYGCPWGEIPFDMNRNTYCGLCMECFKSCPHDNMALNVRPPGADFINERRKTDDMYKRRSWDEAFKAISMLGIFLSFFIAFQGPWAYFKDNVRAVTTEGYLSYIAEAGIVDFLAIPLFFLLFVYLSRLMSGKKEVKLKTIFVNFSYCLVIIGLAIWAAFALGVILPNGSYILHILSDPFALGWDLFGTADSQWTPYLTGAMPVIQIILTLIGLLFALDYGFKFSLKTYGSLAEAKRGWIPMLVFLVLITSGFMWLFVG